MMDDPTNYGIPKVKEETKKPKIILQETSADFIQRKQNEQANKDKPEINLPQEGYCLISQTIEQLIPLLKKRNLFYRVADDSIVEIFDYKLKKVNASRFISLVEEVSTPTVLVWIDAKKCYDSKKKSINFSTCKAILDAHTLKLGLPKIERVVSVPIPFLKEGKLLFPTQGYNEELKLYLTKDSPTLKDYKTLTVKDAKKYLQDLHSEFCFKDSIDMAKALLCLLTPFCRGLYKQWNTRTPLVITFANRPGSGKDYLIGIRQLLFDGQVMEQSPISSGKNGYNDCEELRKKITTTFLSGKNIFHSSNNKGNISNAILEQAITSPHWTDRVLGGNTQATFPNDMEFSLSANSGTTMSGDLVRRVMSINLFYAEEDDNARTYKKNLHQFILEHRGEILSVLYILIKNWVEVGMPNGTNPCTSFPEWARVAGGILEAANIVNPIGVQDLEIVAMDSELDTMKALFEYMYQHHPDKWKKKEEIVNILKEPDLDIDEALQRFDFDKRSDQSRFGRLLKRFYGRELSGVKMVVDTSVRRHKIKFTKKENAKTQLDFDSIMDNQGKK